MHAGCLIAESHLRQALLQAVQYKHPGYPANPDVLQPDAYTPHHAAVAAADAQIKDYLTAIAQSRVCLFDSSVVRKGLAKFFEAMMGSCVPASDLPLEMEEVLRDAMIVLDSSDNEQQIAAKVSASHACCPGPMNGICCPGHGPEQGAHGYCSD